MADDNVVSISFADSSKAYQAFTEIKNLSAAGALQLKSGAIVVRDAEGKLSFPDGVDQVTGTGFAGGGLIGVWDAPPTRGWLFWFLVTGFALIAIGLLAARLERSGVAIPWSFIVFFGLLTLTGVVLMPASGFWLLLFPVAVCLIRRLRR